MSDFKNCPNDEKITHLLSGELTESDKAQLEKDIANNVQLLNEKRETEKLIALLSAHRDQFEYNEGIGANRRDKIFVSNEKRITPIFLRPMFLAAATIFLGVGSFYLFSAKNVVTIDPLNKTGTQVFGVKSFNMAMPSGTYYFTLKEGVLIMDRLEPLNGNDYLKASGLQLGDQILSVNDLVMEKFKMDEWREIITSQVENQNVVLKYKRNGELITFSNKK